MTTDKRAAALDPLTSEELVRLRELCQAATPGPWKCHGETVYYQEPRDYEEAVANCLLPSDAAFIATANPDTVRRLLQQLRDAAQASTNGDGCSVIRTGCPWRIERR